MKRQSFRLGAVHKHYELLKQRSEIELHLATRQLLEIDAEIAGIGTEITSLAAMLSGAAPNLSTAGWIACYRKSEHLGTQLVAARVRRELQATAVDRLEQTRKRWAIAEESLTSLRRNIDADNRAEAAKASQLQLDETVLRQWLDVDEKHTSD